MAQLTRGHTAPAGESTSNEEMARQVAGQTSPDRMAEEIFRAERNGALSDTEAAKDDHASDEVGPTRERVRG